MNDRPTPLEMLLTVVADAAPEPWFPKAHVEKTGSDPDAVSEVLELAWLEKLVEKVTGSPETGPGFVLTSLGGQVLQEPEMAQRLRDGVPLVEDDPGAVVRSRLRQPQRPLVNRLLVAANLAVFAFGLYLAAGENKAKEFLIGLIPNAQVSQIWHKTGSMSAPDILKGEWWRLLTSCFVHAGVLHIGANLYALKNLGGFVEQTWGHARYFLIYFLSGWGGSCLGMALAPAVVVNGVAIPTHQLGASGAVCGVLAATGVWVLLYGKYLPSAMARRGRSAMIINLALIVVISLVPGVSGWGHLGGAVAGGLTALLLHFQRFGPGAMRILAPLLLLPMPWLGVMGIKQAQVNLPKWRLLAQKQDEERHDQREERERKEFNRRFLSKKSPTDVDKIIDDADRAYQTHVPPLLRMHPLRRDADAVRQADKTLAEHHQRLKQLLDALTMAGPYLPETAAEEARQLAREYAQGWVDLIDQARGYLASKKVSRTDEEAIKKQKDKVEALEQRWRKLVPE
jgi:rhomboid protease GluP